MNINKFSFQSSLITKNLLQSKIRINVYESKEDLNNPMARRKYANTRLERLAKPNVRRIKSIFSKQSKKSNFDMKKVETFMKLLKTQSKSSCEVENLPSVKYTIKNRKCCEHVCCCHEKDKKFKILLQKELLSKKKVKEKASSNETDKKIETQHIMEVEKIKKIVDFSIPVDTKNSIPSQRHKNLRTRRQTGFINHNVDDGNSDEEKLSVPHERKATEFLNDSTTTNEIVDHEENFNLIEEENNSILTQARNFSDESDLQILMSTQDEQKESMTNSNPNVLFVSDIDRIIPLTENEIYSKSYEVIQKNSKILDTCDEIEDKTNTSILTDDALSSHLLKAIMSSPSEWQISSMKSENHEYSNKLLELKTAENTVHEEKHRITKPMSTVFATRDYDNKFNENEEKLIHVTNNDIDKVYIVRELENEDDLKKFCKCKRARNAKLFQAVANNPIEIRRLPKNELKKYCGNDQVSDLQDEERFYSADIRQENFRIQRLSDVTNVTAQSEFKKMDIEVRESFTNNSKFTVSRKHM